ncbi:hypothetical protein ACFU9Y_22665 [Streptomyces sp. NPDC057621]|uniref:8-oxoguanine DNA glycosylase OGG fold protein n=1 Tax=Streptomyces sp. NPDC057621 TaxID=3346186 RepID=UPI003690721D
MNEEDRQDGRGRQERADAVDREMATCPLPEAVVRALGRWWQVHASAYADGTPGAHTVRYTPGRWAQITAWPPALAPTSTVDDAAISRVQVAAAVCDALRRDSFREALVATYVWGKGKRGTPGGSGPATLHKILAFDGLDTALATAITALREHSASRAYAALQGQVPGLGPAFFTKFLYFTGAAVAPAHGPRPLILDRVLATRLRQIAATIGRERAHDTDGTVAAWVWSDSNWTPHRYHVYLSYMHTATSQLAQGGSWPSGATPDLLECALFTTNWETPA